MAECREELYVSKKQSRIWFFVAVFLSILTVLDLLGVIGESFDENLPTSVRCPLVNAFLSLPFDPEYKDNEKLVRSRTNCPVITTRRSCIAGSAENIFTDCAAS